MGIAAATDVNNLKCPDGWKALGGGSYHEEGDSAGMGSGRNMMIQEMFDDLKDEYCTNLTDDDYYAYKNTDNTFNYTDGLNENYGCFELVKIDGKDYFVVFSENIDYELESGKPSINDVMLEFNKLNNLEPVEI